MDDSVKEKISKKRALARALRRAPRILWKMVLAIVFVAVALVVAMSVSPIYDFVEPTRFAGPDIYNPYADFDTLKGWKRANFHTHTRVDGLMNECEYWPDKVLEAYENLGYDIVTFSNHNRLTSHPTDAELQVNLYEHGYNLFKFHKLAFGAKEVLGFDHLLPLLASQKQFQIELLSKDADIVQLNHPLRTPTLSESQLQKLSGYRLIELDSGKSTTNEYWDSALSAGRYCFGVANDDLHFPDRSNKIAMRCTFLCTPSAKYGDILATLNKGCFYAMRIPDYGNGDWAAKREGNSSLPRIEDIGLKDSVLYVRFSEPATLVEVTGEHRRVLATHSGCDSVAYAMHSSDPYARVTAYFSDGEVIYTNPFARYDSSVASSPFNEARPQVNIFLTIIFNLLLLMICVADGYLFYKYIIKRDDKAGVER